MKLFKILLTASTLSMLACLWLFIIRNAPGLTALPVIAAMASLYALLYLVAAYRLMRVSARSPAYSLFSGGVVLVSLALLVYAFLDSAVLDYYQPLSLYDDVIAALALWWGLLVLAGLVAMLAARRALPALVRICLLALLAWPLAASLWWINNPQPGPDVESQTHVFSGGEDGYDIYRIPGLTVIPQGATLASGETLPSDRLVAFAEARRDGALDTGVIDLVLKISDDGGANWSTQKVICRHQVGEQRGKCGNPTPVFDRMSGQLVLAYNLSGVEAEGRHHSSHIMFSGDGGLNWGEARQVADDNFVLGPGKGIQKLRSPFSGRLLLPGHTGGKAYLLASDDHGDNWQRTAGLPVADETDVTELADGSLYLATRHRAPIARAPEPNGRQFSLSPDGGVNWPALSVDQALPTPVCQASVITTGQGSLVFSNPAHHRSRVRMTLRHSRDGGDTWDEGRLVYPGPSGYSVLAQGSDNSVYVLYENGNMSYSERISLARVPIPESNPDQPEAQVFQSPLSSLHAELDPIDGGRFIDGQDREVILSGINLKSLGEYWHYNPEIDAVFPFGEEDVDQFADIGWNLVRLVISWSSVEPAPGEYDEEYLDRIEAAVRLFESRGIYTLIDLHQDAWGPSLAAREDENCPEGTRPAVGWDGAPGWATLHKDAPRCTLIHPLLGEREFSPAVMQAFLAFWKDEEGPGGVGIQTRFHAMLSHLAQRFSPFDAVMGYDVMNEPNAWHGDLLALVAPEKKLQDQTEYLSQFYQRALAAIRQGEHKAGSPNRLMLFEPSPDWAQWPGAVRPRFEHDGQVVFSPHIYQGGIVDQPLAEADFQRARKEAAEYGGIPILSGEWGTSPKRALDPADDYYLRHQAYQDQYRIGATLWPWRTACGDPHLAGDPPAGVSLNIWGFYDVDCPSNTTVGYRDEYANRVRRPLVRAAPGRIKAIHWNHEQSRFSVSGHSAVNAQTLVLFVHQPVTQQHIRSTGLEDVALNQDIGPGQIWTARATAADWSLQIDLRENQPEG